MIERNDIGNEMRGVLIFKSTFLVYVANQLAFPFAVTYFDLVMVSICFRHCDHGIFIFWHRYKIRIGKMQKKKLEEEEEAEHKHILMVFRMPTKNTYRKLDLPIWCIFITNTISTKQPSNRIRNGQMCVNIGIDKLILIPFKLNGTYRIIICSGAL